MTKKVTKNNKATNLTKHQNLLKSQEQKYQAKAQKLDNKIQEKHYSEKRTIRKGLKIMKHQNKANKFQTKDDTHYEKTSKNDV